MSKVEVDTVIENKLGQHNNKHLNLQWRQRSGHREPLRGGYFLNPKVTADPCHVYLYLTQDCRTKHLSGVLTGNPMVSLSSPDLIVYAHCGAGQTKTLES